MLNVHTTNSALNTLYIVQNYTYCTVYNVQITNSVQCTYCKHILQDRVNCIIVFVSFFLAIFSSKAKGRL